MLCFITSKKKKGKNASQTSNKMCSVYRNDAVSINMGQMMIYLRLTYSMKYDMTWFPTEQKTPKET